MSHSHFRQNDIWKEPDGALWRCFQVEGFRAWFTLESWVHQHKILETPPPGWVLHDRAVR